MGINVSPLPPASGSFSWYAVPHRTVGPQRNPFRPSLIVIVSEAPMLSPTADRPALSLVIPVYNAADQLPATLDAIDAFVLRYPSALEVLFVDDHSPEVETQRLLANFVRTRSYARVLRNQVNSGKGFSVTRGMLAARGRHRVFTDVDLA